MPKAFRFLIVLALPILLQPGGCSSPERTTVVIQPYRDLPPAYAHFVLTEIKKIYPDVVLKPPVALPEGAYFAARKRYRADSLIRSLRNYTASGFVTIGLTSKDISVTGDQVNDWGVMGYGYCPGRACVASSFRLSAKNKKGQLFKVAIHELGHTRGLEHCAMKSCFMRDAKGKNPTDEETEFCVSCRKKLVRRGWKFN